MIMTGVAHASQADTHTITSVMVSCAIHMQVAQSISSNVGEQLLYQNSILHVWQWLRESMSPEQVQVLREASVQTSQHMLQLLMQMSPIKRRPRTVQVIQVAQACVLLVTEAWGIHT